MGIPKWLDFSGQFLLAMNIWLFGREGAKEPRYPQHLLVVLGFWVTVGSPVAKKRIPTDPRASSYCNYEPTSSLQCLSQPPGVHQLKFNFTKLSRFPLCTPKRWEGQAAFNFQNATRCKKESQRSQGVIPNRV